MLKFIYFSKSVKQVLDPEDHHQHQNENYYFFVILNQKEMGYGIFSEQIHIRQQNRKKKILQSNQC